MKRYLLCPGYVISQTDGDLHYISAPKLARLYGVNLNECVSDSDRLQSRNNQHLTKLFPRFGGDYSLPE